MSWKRVKLSEVLKQYRIEHIVQNDKIYKQVSILNNGSVVLRGEKIGKEIGRKRQFVIDIVKYPNTLIFTRQLLLQGSIGLANDEVNQCIVTENMPMFSVDISRVTFNYIGLFIKSDIFKRQVGKIELSGSAQKSIHERTFLNLEIPLPSIQEQNEVVANFSNSNSHIDLLSSELTHQLTLVKKLRQQLLQDAVQGKLVEQNKSRKLSGETGIELLKQIKAEKAKLIAEGKLKKEKPLPPIKPEEIPFEIPENWVWCRLGEICETRLGKMLDGIKNKGELFPYFRNLNVQWYNFELDDVLQMKFQKFELEEYSVKKGDLLICEGGYPGRGAIWESEDESYKFQKALHRVRFYNKIPAKLYLYYLDWICSSGMIAEYTTGSGIQHLTGISLKKMPIPLPPLNEQNRIVEKLDELMQYCNELEESIKESQEQNEKLLQQVLREALRK